MLPIILNICIVTVDETSTVPTAVMRLFNLCLQLHFLNQDHFQDVIEERAISKICGYPLCAGKLKNIPSKQFHISTQLNKVFDITDRKVRVQVFVVIRSLSDAVVELNLIKIITYRWKDHCRDIPFIKKAEKCNYHFNVLNCLYFLVEKPQLRTSDVILLPPLMMSYS